MRIATYNVNGIKARLPRLIEWLDEQKPDVVCLQELKSSDETLPVADIASATPARTTPSAASTSRACPTTASGRSATH